MNNNRTVVVLDCLFDDLDIESAVAQNAGWRVARWDGSEAMLQAAEIVVHVRTRIDAAMLERLPACRVVGRFGTGLDTVNLAMAEQRGIRVVGVRDYCIPELASHTLGLAFALDRGLDTVRAGRLTVDASWQEVASRQPMPGRTTATVIGFGSVGAAVTQALVPLGISVRVVTTYAAERARAAGALPVTLEAGLADAGFVFLHAALNKATAGMIDRERLASMSPGTILVNTARIALIDEAAVATALLEGQLGGLGLDAKLAADSPLRPFLRDDRALITPHIGWYSERSARELRRRTIANAIDAHNVLLRATEKKPGETR